MVRLFRDRKNNVGANEMYISSPPDSNAIIPVISHSTGGALHLQKVGLHAKPYIDG